MAEHTRIVSSTPVRTRIRLSPKRRNTNEMARLARAIQASPKVSRVETNLNAGTLIVHHREEALPDIKAGLKDLGVILMAATGAETSAKSLSEAVSDLDRHLGSRLSGGIDFKLLVPLGFGGLALAQLARRGLEIGSAPWYLLAYFALDSFIRLNTPEGKGVQAEPTD